MTSSTPSISSSISSSRSQYKGKPIYPPRMKLSLIAALAAALGKKPRRSLDVGSRGFTSGTVGQVECRYVGGRCVRYLPVPRAIARKLRSHR